MLLNELRPRLAHSLDNPDPDLSSFPLRVFQPRLVGLLFRFERFRQRRKFEADVFEKQPLFNDFRHALL